MADCCTPPISVGRDRAGGSLERWRWTIHHPHTHRTLLTGHAASRKAAQRAGDAAAARWVDQYGHLG